MDQNLKRNVSNIVAVLRAKGALPNASKVFLIKSAWGVHAYTHTYLSSYVYIHNTIHFSERMSEPEMEQLRTSSHTSIV